MFPPVKRHKKIQEKNLEDALRKCREAARRGYELAQENLKETSKIIKKISASLSDSLKSFDEKSIRTPEIESKLKEQLSDAVQGLKNLKESSMSALEEKRKRLDTFSITLFGRTKAGKSTLMEILTQGTGESIGNEAQRTTRDIRCYQWNGLEVTDVPGVAAFDGKEDEELAMEAAKQADLILFLITDDSPQPNEAEWLAKLCSLGKPVLGICNIRVAVDDEEDLMLFLRYQKEYFDKTRIDEILKTFHNLVNKYKHDIKIPFVVTHLRSRFLASLPKYKKNQQELIDASRFENLESRILSEVKKRGIFLRIKNFIDSSFTPMMSLTDQLLEFSAQNSTSGRVLIDKKRQLSDWAQDFKSRGQARIDTLILRITDSLRNEISTFAEDHYEDRNAGKAWKRLVESHNLTGKTDTLQKELINESKKALNEIARELKSELECVSKLSINHHIKMDTIFNTKFFWKLGVGGIAVALGIAALFTSLPLGVAVAVGWVGRLISRFFDDRETKARKARENLRKRLSRNVDNMGKNLQKSLKNWFYQELLKKQIYVCLEDMDMITSGLFKLSDAQRELAWALNKRQKKLAFALIGEALSLLDSSHLLKSIKDIARVPRATTMFLIEPGFTFPENVQNSLERLLEEKICFIVDTKRKFSLLAQAIGKNCDRHEIGVEKKLPVVHVPFDELDNRTKTRVKLAQQLTEIHIMRK